MEQKNVWETYSTKQLKELEALNEAYRGFLSECKTERECVDYIVNMAEEAGYKELQDIIKKGGRLILSDLFHINPERNFIKAVRIEADRQAMRKHKEGDCEERTAKAVDFRHDGKFIIGPLGDQLEEMGFIITHFEDRTEDLTQYMAETILDGKEDSIICNVKNKKNTGYFMLVAQKR